MVNFLWATTTKTSTMTMTDLDRQMDQLFYPFHVHVGTIIRLAHACGIIRSCIISLQPPVMEKEEELKDLKHRAQVRLILWLGLEKDQQNWKECYGDGEVTLYAETVS